MLGSLHPEASLPGEVIPGAEFYSYADKYEDGAAQLVVPAVLPEAVGRASCGPSLCVRSRRVGARAWRVSISSTTRVAAASS